MKHLRLFSLIVLGLLSVQSFAQGSKPKKPAANEQKEISPAVQIYFETNKSVIKPAEIAKLKRLLDTLDTKDEFRLILTGHTDSTGNDELNLKLSQARVDGVFQYLVENDIEGDFMMRQYFGRAKPREKEETSEEKKAKNRRVEITILEKPKPIEKPKPKPVYKDTCTRDTTVFISGLGITMKACDLAKLCPRGTSNCIKIKKMTSIEELIGSGIPLNTAKGEGLNWGGAYEVRLPGDSCAVVPVTMTVSLDAAVYKKAKLQVYTRDGETGVKPDKTKKLGVAKGKEQNKYSFPLSCNGSYLICGGVGKSKTAIIQDKTGRADEMYVISQSTMAIIPCKKIGKGKWEVSYSKIEDPTLTIKLSDGETVVSDINMNSVRKMKKPGILRKKYKVKMKHLNSAS